MEEASSGKKLTARNIIETLIIGMILFMTGMVTVSILTSKYDIIGMIVGTSLIFMLLLFKSLIKESGIE
jgi:hypothetical protein